MKYFFNRQFLIVFAIITFLLPAVSLVFAAGPMYSYDADTGLVADTDHANHFYRVPYDAEGDSVFLSQTQFTYGYGYGAKNGLYGFGYGYGYGGNYYSSIANGIVNNDTRLGFFVGNALGTTYDSAVLPIDIGVAAVPAAFNLIDENVAIKLFEGTQISGPEEWDGELVIDEIVDIDTLIETYPDFGDVFDSESNVIAVTVQANVEESLSLSDEAIIILSTAFDPESQVIYFGSIDGTVDEIPECSVEEYAFDHDNDIKLSDNSSYDLEAEADCYVNNVEAETVYVATRHFTAFAIGEPVQKEEVTDNSSGGSGSRTSKNDAVNSSPSFIDTKGHWALSYINKLVAKGIVNGRSNSVFAPNENMNRAELVKVAVLASGGVSKNPVRALYSDVNLNDWFASYLSVALDKGIAHGYADGRFMPASFVTRAEALKMILVATGADVSGAKGVSFADVPVTEWYATYVKYAKDNDIVAGYADGLFYPNQPVTRAEVAKMLSLAMGI